MIRVSFLSPNAGQRSITFASNSIRFGSDPRCEVCLVVSPGDAVAPLHGEISIERGSCYIFVRDEHHPLWMDGVRTLRCQIEKGTRFRVGSPRGPEIFLLEFEEEDVEGTVQVKMEELEKLHAGPSRAPPKPERERPLPAPAEERSRSLKPLPPAPPPGPVLPPPHPRESVVAPPRLREGFVPAAASAPPLHEVQGTMGRALQILRKPHEEVQQWLSRAQKELSRARSRSDGLSSGHTMVIMARALTGMRQTAEGRAKKTRRNLILSLSASLALVLCLSGIVWFQQRRIGQIAGEKAAIDAQIQRTFDAMAQETDEEKLAELETRMQHLMGSATEKVAQVGRTSARKAEELAKPMDAREQEIRVILRSFNTETYAIPPIFRRVLDQQIKELLNNGGLRSAWARRQKHWPQIRRALRRYDLPEELGYIAFTESRFDPTAVNAKSKASGMWQLMDETARGCGITVNANRDDRFEPTRSTEAAACYLSKLLIEFGQESFMLVLASYNRGENGVRRALHKVAKEPGGYRKRDFWHLYRLKLLPEETRDYVPRVIAAAIVFGNPQRYGLEPSTTASR